MKKTVSKAATLSLNDLDFAVSEALQRVAKARELHVDECADVAGGIGVRYSDFPFGGPTVGMMPLPREPGNEIM